jgi:hypothetical protein
MWPNQQLFHVGSQLCIIPPRTYPASRVLPIGIDIGAQQGVCLWLEQLPHCACHFSAFLRQGRPEADDVDITVNSSLEIGNMNIAVWVTGACVCVCVSVCVCTECSGVYSVTVSVITWLLCTHAHTQCARAHISVSQNSRMWNESYTQIHTIFTVYNTTNILQNTIVDNFHAQKIHLYSKIGVYLSIFWRLLYILPFHSWWMSEQVVKCWQFCCQHRMYCLKTR